MFQPPETEVDAQILSQYEAAVTSTNQKVKTFQFLGCDVNRIELASNIESKEFERIIQSAVN